MKMGGIKFCSLSSGSSGNCQYIETDRIRILIDGGGLSGKKNRKGYYLQLMFALQLLTVY